MLSRVSASAARNAALRPPVVRTAAVQLKRAYVQPSGADRASVVEVPSAYQEDAFLSPRSGTTFRMFDDTKLSHTSDMLGFKVEIPRREDSVEGKTRPIYLDMQV